MAGHSKWAQIKHKKAKVDQKRGKIFGKLIREIMVAVRVGGSGDPDLNPRLRLAIEKAKEHNMPMENIQRAIKKALGKDEEASKLEEVIYEGYGPGGVAIMAYALTDNRTRTAQEVRHIFTKYGGKMAKEGAVSWQFEDKGIIHVEKGDISEDEIFEIALEAGAEDIKTHSDTYEIVTSPQDFENVKKALQEKGLKIVQADLTKIPQNTVSLDEERASQVLKLIEALEEHDDIQKVYANFDIKEEILQKIAAKM